MEGDRIESAVQRIEAALARIATAADTLRPAPPSVSALVVRHETLRETVGNVLKEIEDLIAEVEA